MKPTLIAALLFAAGTLLAPAPVNCFSSPCGIRPAEIAPIPPPGCTRMVQECSCNKRGQNCKWVWICSSR